MCLAGDKSISSFYLWGRIATQLEFHIINGVLRNNLITPISELMSAVIRGWTQVLRCDCSLWLSDQHPEAREGAEPEWDVYRGAAWCEKHLKECRAGTQKAGSGKILTSLIVFLKIPVQKTASTSDVQLCTPLRSHFGVHREVTQSVDPRVPRGLVHSGKWLTSWLPQADHHSYIYTTHLWPVVGQ